MRDIIFRGKRLDNGEWVYGSLLQVEYEDGSVVTAIFDRKDSGGDAEVHPSTVGQYTGLNDKHGNRIFEGGIIRTHYANTRKNDFIEQVVFHNGRFCSLYKIPGPGNGKIWSNLPDGVLHLPKDKTPYMEWCEVIGDIHDGGLEFLNGGEE